MLKYALNCLAWPMNITNSVFFVGHGSHTHSLCPYYFCLIEIVNNICTEARTGYVLSRPLVLNLLLC